MNLHVRVQYTGHWYDVRYNVDRMKCPQHKHLHELRPRTAFKCKEVHYLKCEAPSNCPFQSTNQHGLNVSETITKIHPNKNKSQVISS